MILTGVFRLCTCIADYFQGKPGQRTAPSMAASIALASSPVHRIIENRFSKGRSLSSQISELRPLVCSTQGITPRPWISGLAHWGDSPIPVK
ncbi:hypothetical protein D3C75_444100 [compost metagenome]|nr:hypothetical protein C1X65_09525 [Pseudomonas sp. FW305-70]